MCGILGLATIASRAPSVGLPTAERMRDTMAHRGPDGRGLWRDGSIILAHRRLAVVDTSPAGHQPMVAEDGRSAIVYNGELYNDAELREQLAAAGVRLTGTSDTQTVLHALRLRGRDALPRLRGMYALAFADTRERTVLLARDPLGIKPLYYTVIETGGGQELVFASEPQAILAHPGITARPDPVGISGYLTTIRTVLGSRTLFDGIRTLRPGESILFDLSGDSIRQDARETPLPSIEAPADPTAAVRAALHDSARRHLRADVPVCCLLSGGLDSSILAALASREAGTLHTYCSGAPSAGGEAGDFASARVVAAHLSTDHAEAPVTRTLFAQRWPEMVAAMGIPLSTPNEVAINEVARALRARGHVVALGGEGADELFAGYEAPMLDAARFEGLLPPTAASALPSSLHPGHFQLLSSAWVPPEHKPAILNPDLWRALEGDEALIGFYTSEFDTLSPPHAQTPLDRLGRHLRFHRRINLAGLLSRLDTATMLASVEGRTPFADSAVAALAESLPMAAKFDPALAPSTKLILRRAFAADLPAPIIARPKASFPLPFQSWAADRADALLGSSFARGIFTEAAIHTVAARPTELWNLAWPMINLALWGQRWWG